MAFRSLAVSESKESLGDFSLKYLKQKAKKFPLHSTY